MAVEERTERLGGASRLIPRSLKWANIPYSAIVVVIAGTAIAYSILTSQDYRDAFFFLSAGIRVTITVSLIAFGLSLILGLVAGLGRISKNPVYHHVTTLYVEVVRGVPLLIMIIYFAYVVTPLFIELLDWLGGILLNTPLASWGRALTRLNIQSVDMTVRAIVGLAFGYGAFEAEIFRAGFESIDRGQMEAARSLGMSHAQAMRYVILPQAIRRVLPPLGNDFVAILKDSSLLSVLAVRELTQLGKLNRARTFTTYETWNTVAFLYLAMTLVLSLGVRALERRLRVEK